MLYVCIYGAEFGSPAIQKTSCCTADQLCYHIRIPDKAGSIRTCIHFSRVLRPSHCSLFFSPPRTHLFNDNYNTLVQPSYSNVTFDTIFIFFKIIYLMLFVTEETFLLSVREEPIYLFVSTFT